MSTTIYILIALMYNPDIDVAQVAQTRSYFTSELECTNELKKNQPVLDQAIAGKDITAELRCIPFTVKAEDH
jgi:hypothetical protein